MGAAKVYIVNHTTRPLKLKVGNQLVFTDLATVEQDTEYNLKVDGSSTFREYFLGVDACGNLLVVSAHEFKHTRSVVVKEEVDGSFHVQMVSRHARPTGLSWNRVKSSFWKFWQ